MPASEIMKDFHEHNLHSGASGKIVTNPKQAKAIQLSYLRKEGHNIPMKKDSKEKHHPYSHTTIEHHKDKSHTVTHHHESGDPKMDMKHAVADLDGAHDSMEEHLGTPNEGEGTEPEAEEAGAAPAAGGAGQ